ncbi:hypothetical protein V5799_026993, partial [Amblyomma americanum]
MAWTTVLATQPEAPAEPARFEHEELFQRVTRRGRAGSIMAAAKSAASQAKQQALAHGPASSRRNQAQSRQWKPRPMPQMHPEDYVVIKPRVTADLRNTFQR